MSLLVRRVVEKLRHHSGDIWVGWLTSHEIVYLIEEAQCVTAPGFRMIPYRRVRDFAETRQATVDQWDRIARFGRSARERMLSGIGTLEMRWTYYVVPSQAVLDSLTGRSTIGERLLASRLMQRTLEEATVDA